MASTYTKARLQSALRVYGEARERAKLTTSSKLQRRFRDNYRFRRADPPSHLPNATSWEHDDDTSSDEYNPETSKKRRPVAPRAPKPKRLKQDPQVANPKHTTSGDVDLEPASILVTLKLWSAGGKIVLNALAGQYGTGYEKQNPDESDDTATGRGRRQSGQTYLEKQDEESGKIGERTTRSGLKRKITKSAKIQHGIPSPTKVSNATGEAGTKPLTLTTSNAQPTPSPSPLGQRPIDYIRTYFHDYHALGEPGMRQNPIVLDSPSPTPTPEPVVKPNPLSTFMINTPWAHPINFKHEPRSGRPCHFCDDFRYGVFGYGLIDARVSRQEVGTQLEEAEDGSGHRSRGKEATRMCIPCSLRRIHISSCKVHSITQFINADAARFKVYMAQLLDERYPNCRTIKCGVYYTCSLCAQPAFWRCVADQTLDRNRQELSKQQGKGKGCGLFLCHSCAGNLRADKGILKKTAVRKPEDHDCRRADMEFLFLGSLLHKMYK